LRLLENSFNNSSYGGPLVEYGHNDGEAGFHFLQKGLAVMLIPIFIPGFSMYRFVKHRPAIVRGTKKIHLLKFAIFSTFVGSQGIDHRPQIGGQPTGAARLERK
jgi:hypothetical protein